MKLDLSFSCAVQSALLLLSQRVLPTNAQTEGLSPVVQKLKAKVIELGNAVNAISPAILPALVGNDVIRDPFVTTATGYAILGFYAASNGMPYNGCKNEVFGIDGEYTDLICDLAQVVSSEVCKQEDACDSSVWNAIPITSMRGDAFQNTELAASVVCAVNTPYVVSNCPESVFSQFIPAVQQLQGLISIMPDGFNNLLLTNSGQLPVQLTPELSHVLPTRVSGFGIGSIELRKDIYGKELMPIYLKSLAIFNLAAYIQDSYEKQSEDTLVLKNRFRIYGVEGYLTQKYKHMFFTEDELSSSFQEYLGPNYTDGKERWCANNLGAYYAWNCTTLDEFMIIQDQIVNEINLTSTNGCEDLVSEEYISMIKTGKKVMESNTMGARCTNACTDNTEKFYVEGTAGNGMRTCDWAIRMGGTDNKGIPKRCSVFSAVEENCSDTCGKCCVDTTERFYVSDLPVEASKGKMRNCAWAGRRSTNLRCAMDGVAGNCPQTCGVGCA